MLIVVTLLGMLGRLRVQPILVKDWRRCTDGSIILNFDEYESMQATLEVLSDPELVDQVRRGREYFAKGGKGLTIEQAFRREP